MKRKVFISLYALILVSLVSLNSPLYSAPYDGDRFSFTQPDGSEVWVRVYGDEFYQRVESMDGYSLIRNEQEWICYAILSHDGTEYQATDIIYTGKPDSRLHQRGIPQSIRISDRSILAKVDQRMNALGYSEDVKRVFREGAVQPVSGQITGLTVIIDFSDEQAKFPKSEIEDFCNKKGYNNFRNNGSICEFYSDVSNGKMNYTNIVTDYYRAKKPKTYYDENKEQSQKPLELMKEALESIEANGFDFSKVTQKNGTVQAANFLYAGSPKWGWAKGLWPACYPPDIAQVIFTSKSGIKVKTCQYSNIGDSIRIGTFAHENGHMVGGFPDLYDYYTKTRTVGAFCLMGRGCKVDSGANPIPPNAYLRHLIGWENPTDITNAPKGQLFKHTANSYASFIFKKKSSTDERFYIESRIKKGRNKYIPDEGLLIWHYDKNGNNTKPQGTHLMLSVEQADGKMEMEKATSGENGGDGGEGDLFHKGDKDKFNETTTPNSNWWDNSASGMSISNISAVGDEMSFTIGDSPTSIEKKDISLHNKFTVNSLGTNLIISYKATLGTRMELTIYDCAGKELFKHQWSSFTNNPTHEFIRMNKVIATGYYLTTLNTISSDNKIVSTSKQHCCIGF